jgi:hypothetical protein
MDTRFWGPPGWQLFHLIAFRSEHPDDVLNDMKDVLPCKFCRASTTEFVKKHPLRGDPGKWLYEIHNMVNGKLRTQAKDDPKVIDPGPDPDFEEIKSRYMEMKPTKIPGRDFLMAIAYNYPEAPEPHDMSTQREFIHHLADAYPFGNLRKIFKSYLDKNEVELGSRMGYLRWMYGLMQALAKETKTKLRSFKGYVHHLAYYKAGCIKKTYKGKTCRKTMSGGYTKNRDNKKTRRVVGSGLL